MSYFIGTTWAVVFGVLALIGLGITLYAAFIQNKTSTGRIGLMVSATVMTIGLSCLTYVAKTQFRVPVNTRALLVDTIHQVRVGVRESGIQVRPLIGINVTNWPATRADLVSFSMDSGLASAPSAVTHTPLKLGVDFYVDLSNLDIMTAHKDGYTTYTDFLNRYVLLQAANVARSITQQYSVEEHNTKKNEWALDFETAQQAFYDLPNKGYGLRVVSGRAIMTWDFLNEDDGKAYDLANRSNFLKLDKANQEAAALKDADIATARFAVLSATSTEVTESWQGVLNFLRPLSAEDREFIYRYMSLQSDLEYLRLVGDQKPATIFPPGSSPVPTFNTGK